RRLMQQKWVRGALFASAAAVLATALNLGATPAARAAEPDEAPRTASAPAGDPIPQLGSRNFGWNANFWDFQLDPPQGSGHGPIKTDPNYPYKSQIQNGGFFAGGELRPPIVNAKDPILKPWASEQMQATNEEVLSGKRPLPFISQSRCWPGGVPGQLLFLQPVYFLQTPNEVWMIWERDHFVRRIYLTGEHSENVKPSWFGESIGH